MKKGRRPRRRPRLKLSDKAGPDQCPVPGENALFPAQIAGFLAVSRAVPVYPVFLNYVVPVQNRSITIQKNESCIYAGHDGTEYICYKKDSNFSFKSIKIPIPYFSQLLADYFDGQEITVYEKKLLNGIAKVSVTPIMEQILSETSKFSQYRGGLGYLYLDGKLLELLSIYLGEVLELDILMGKNISMSRTERTAIMEAKRIIDSQLAFAPSCEELSQQVHLSLTKLTRGFSSFYGMPIHQYVIEQRLTQAAQLLLDGDWNVGEVAAIVGYGKPSNFAAAFKKKYGVAPKHYRETRFNHTKQ